MQIYDQESNHLQRYLEALELFGIDVLKFSHIHTQELKRKHLKYIWLQTEFNIISRQEENKFDTELLHSIKEAYELLLHSPLITAHQSPYSQHSVGLQEIDIRSTHQDKKEVIEEESNEQELLNQSVIPEKPKKSGVEPGFEALQKIDVLFDIYQQVPNDQERWKYIAQNPKEIFRIHRIKESLAKYLVKLDYRKITKGIVSAEEKDLKRSKTLQRIYDRNALAGMVVIFAYMQVKKRSFVQINKDAVREVLGNDIMRAYGIPTQEQYLFLGRYDDARLKLMLKSEWVKNASELGPIFGSNNNNNYRANPVLISSEQIAYLADDSIKNLAECLPGMIILGDRDGIGSSAQNKLQKDKKFICIDTGHAFEDDVTDQVSEFFTIKNPTFKNYSIFFSPRSEILRGIIKLAKLADYPLSEKLLNSYDSEFAKAITTLDVKADEQIFDDYILKFRELKKEISENQTGAEKTDNVRCCEEIIDDLIKNKKEAIVRRNKLVDKFKKYLLLDRKSNDLLEHIEKYLVGKSEGTTLRSSDHTTLLNHLKVDEAKISWTVDIPEQEQDKCQFNFKFNNPEAFSKAVKDIRAWLELNNLKEVDFEKYFTVDSTNSRILFSFDYSNLSQLCGFFSEEKLMKFFHPKDHALLRTYRLEKELIEITNLFLKYNVKAKLTPHNIEEIYQIEFEQPVDEKFFAILKKYFADFEKSLSINVKFQAQEMNNICNTLRAALIEYEREHVISRELPKIEQSIQAIQHLEPNFIFKIERISQQNAFSYHIDTSHCNLLFIEFLQKHPLDYVSEEIKASDLLYLHAALENYVSGYNALVQKTEKLSITLIEYNKTFMDLLNLETLPFQFKTHLEDFEIIFDNNLPKEFLELASKHLAAFRENKESYLIKHGQVAEFTKLLQTIHDSYQELLIEKQICESQPSQYDENSLILNTATINFFDKKPKKEKEQEFEDFQLISSNTNEEELVPTLHDLMNELALSLQPKLPETSFENYFSKVNNLLGFLSNKVESKNNSASETLKQRINEFVSKKDSTNLSGLKEIIHLLEEFRKHNANESQKDIINKLIKIEAKLAEQQTNTAKYI